MYVALTRARHTFTFTSAANYDRGFGGGGAVGIVNSSADKNSGGAASTPAPVARRGAKESRFVRECFADDVVDDDGAATSDAA